MRTVTDRVREHALAPTRGLAGITDYTRTCTRCKLRRPLRGGNGSPKVFKCRECK
jgi:hypothetical protein